MKKIQADNETETVLAVRNLHKSFKLPHESHSGIKQQLINFLRKNTKKGYEIQKVLKNVSFDVKKGDFFGIVGRNGSGKSTLLKLMAGIYEPDSGEITTNGSIVPFIELGVGFNPELTGRENIFLNGALLGFSRHEVRAMYDEIVQFAELEKFMDQKLKNYSSGMQVRLAFSIAIQARGDILILDEVLAVGDEAFQRKCDAYFDQIKKDKTKTVILVTHSMGSVKKYCNKAILLKDGNILVSGDPNDVANQYTEENTNSNSAVPGSKTSRALGLSDRVPIFRIVPVSKKVVSRNQNFDFDIEYDFNETASFYLAFSLVDLKRGGITYDSGAMMMEEVGHRKARYSLPLSLFNDTDFHVVATLRVLNKDNTRELVAYTSENNSCFFSVRTADKSEDYALLRSLKK